MHFSRWRVNSDWTLFLDRDGVINERITGGYVTKWSEFRFLPGVKEALAGISGLFGPIIVVSNQQGIGKGIMDVNAVEWIHRNMVIEINRAGGRIDRVYYSPYLESESHPDRKPGTGMAFKAKKDFPSIDFQRAVMIGDSPNDMRFGRKLGMKTVFIGDENLEDPSLADERFDSLADFAASLKSLHL